MNRINKSTFFLWCLFTISITVFSQNTVIDSLETKLKSHKENDTLRVNLLNKLALYYFSTNINKAEDMVKKASSLAKKIGYIKGEAKSHFLYSKINISKSELNQAVVNAEQALKLYEKINDYSGIASTYSALGTIGFYKNDPDKALLYFNKALNVAEKNSIKNKQADILNNIGNVSYIKGDLETAITIYKKAITVYEALGNQKGAFYPLNNVAVIYNRQGKFIEALDYFNKCLLISKEQKNNVNIAAVTLNMATVYADRLEHRKALSYYSESLRINKELNNSREASKCLIGLGGVFEASKEHQKALDNYTESLKINKAINSTEGLVTAYDNIGSVNLMMKQPKIALENFKTCLSLSKSLQNKRTIGNAHISLAETYFILKNYTQALNHALQGKQLADDLTLLPKQKDVNKVLSKIYEATGAYEKSLQHYKIHKTLNDSLFNKENIEKIVQLEYEYKYKQQVDAASIRELKLTKMVQSTSQDLEKSKQKYLWAIIGVLLVSILLGAIIFYQKLRNEKSKTQNIVMEQKLLRSQMTPHFIFNSLSVLQGMILNKEEKKSIHYLSKFSKLLRITLENSRDKTVSLSEELKAVHEYLTLQNLENEAYKGLILVEDSVEVLLFEIPPMLIQPFVENAVEHAFVNIKENRQIEIRISYLDKKLICTIMDNGVGISFKTKSKRKDKKSLATTITSERLKVLSKDFKMEGSLTIEDRKKFNTQGTLVTLVIPHKLLTNL